MDEMISIVQTATVVASHQVFLGVRGKLQCFCTPSTLAVVHSGGIVCLSKIFKPARHPHSSFDAFNFRFRTLEGGRFFLEFDGFCHIWIATTKLFLVFCKNFGQGSHSIRGIQKLPEFIEDSVMRRSGSSGCSGRCCVGGGCWCGGVNGGCCC